MNHGILYYIWGQFTARGRIYIYGALAVLIVILIIGNQISSCRVNNSQKKIEKAKDEINQHIGENIILEQNRNAAVDKVEVATQLSQEATEAVQEESVKDSATKDPDFDKLMHRFCTEEKLVVDQNCRTYFGVK